MGRDMCYRILHEISHEKRHGAYHGEHPVESHRDHGSMRLVAYLTGCPMARAMVRPMLQTINYGIPREKCTIV